jgi:hypothetical protein
MKKIIIAIIVLVVLVVGYFIIDGLNNNQVEPQIVGGDKDEHGCIGSAGYSWCEAKGKCLRVFEELCEDQLIDLVQKIKENSDAEFVLKGTTDINWNVSDGKTYTSTTISGFLYQIDDIKRADYDKIEKFFTDNHTIDIANVADGVIGGLRGYIINYMACTLNFQHNQLKKNNNAPAEIIGDSMTVKLECGYYNSNNANKILTEQKIKEILAAKYEKALSNITVNITKSDETHVAGNISFLTNGQSGEGGLFLAIKENEEWKVVFDGNGSIDCNMMRTQYQFSDDLLKPNFCD